MSFRLLIIGSVCTSLSLIVRVFLSERLALNRRNSSEWAWRLSMFMWALPVFGALAVAGLVGLIVQ
jgi:hypothetical protein